jgi:Fe-Mn family superoxide dismutase
MASPIELPPLPYSQDALDPVISSRTLDFHYGKHHQAYVTKLNAAIEGTEWAEKSLEEIIKGNTDKPAIFNNGAQVWNHTFYWNCMRGNAGGQPTGKVKDMIDSSFGGYDKFREEFKNAAMTQFGSGWAWLVENGGKLEIAKTPNAETPLTTGKKALITIDVWEHAYYLDFQNKRDAYIDAWLDKLVNWDWANEQLG